SSAALGRVATSPDGETWTQQTAAINAQWDIIGWNGSYFVALRVGVSTGGVMKSADGITWTAFNLPSTAAVRGIASGNGIWVGVASGGSERVVTSTDGETWTGRTAAQALFWRSVAYGNGIFVAVASSGT